MDPFAGAEIDLLQRSAPWKSRRSSRRNRSSFTEHQLQILEENFNEHPYLDRIKRSYLCSLLGIEDYKVGIWYQNHRMLLKRQWVELNSTLGEKAVSSSEYIALKKIIDKFLPGKINKRKRSSESSLSSPPRKNSKNIPVNHRNRAPARNRSTLKSVNIPPRATMGNFCPRQQNWQNTSGEYNVSTSASMIRDDARHSVQLHDSFYTQFAGSQNPIYPPTPVQDTNQTFRHNLMHQKQQNVSHASVAYRSRTELGNMRSDNYLNHMYQTAAHTAVYTKVPNYHEYNKNSGNLQYNHYVPNNFDLNSNFYAPGNTNNGFPDHSSQSFNQPNSFYPCETSNIQIPYKFQSCKYEKQHFPVQARLPDPAYRFSGKSKDSTVSNPTNFDFSSLELGTNHNSTYLDGSNVSNASQQPDSYNNYQSSTSSTSLAGEGNYDCKLDNISTDLNWEQVLMWCNFAS